MVIQALADAALEGEERFTVQLLSARNEAVIDPTKGKCLDYSVPIPVIVSQHYSSIIRKASQSLWVCQMSVEMHS